MNKEDLKNKAKDIFKDKPKETVLYCIEDGNFWYASKKVSADIYSRKLGLELIEIKKEDLIENKVTKVSKEVIKPKTKSKKVTKPKVKSKK